MKTGSGEKERVEKTGGRLCGLLTGMARGSAVGVCLNWVLGHRDKPESGVICKIHRRHRQRVWEAVAAALLMTLRIRSGITERAEKFCQQPMWFSNSI